MHRDKLYLITGIVIVCVLLAPGVWWQDSLNAYIQGVTGAYGAAQPPFLALLCKFTRNIYTGSLPIFLLCILLFFIGFHQMVFRRIKHRLFAPAIFFTAVFFPPLFANIGVVQTEALQLALLAFFIPLPMKLYEAEGKRRLVLFVLMSLPLCVFSVVRYDAFFITLLLAYLLCFSYTRKHGAKALLLAAAFFLIFRFAAVMLDSVAGVSDEGKREMRNSLLVADLAAISAETKINYVPDYCWRAHLAPEERTVDKIIYGRAYWDKAFYSYLYNPDARVGLFTYNTTPADSALFKLWLEIVLRHPRAYLRYHAQEFKNLLLNNYFNMGLSSGLRNARQNQTRLSVENTEALTAFLQKHGKRFRYEEGWLVLFNDAFPISPGEEKDLLALAGSSRAGDVAWMKWFSQIPAKTYNRINPVAEKFVNPACEVLKAGTGWMFLLIVHFIALPVLLLLFRKEIRHRFQRTAFVILCLCGILHLVSRFFLVTDPVYRFGMIVVLFTFYAFIILLPHLFPRLASK